MYDEKANRQYYRDLGRCPYCSGKNFVTPGYKTCPDCREKKAQNWRDRAKRNKEQGVCTRCGKPREDNKWKRCKACRDQYTDTYGELRKYSAKHRRETLKEAGKCTRCGIRFAEPGHVKCRKCMDKGNAEAKKSDPNNEKRNARRREWRESGLCVDCGAPAFGKCRCPKHAEMQRDSCRKYTINKRIDKEAADARRGIYRA